MWVDPVLLHHHHPMHLENLLRSMLCQTLSLFDLHNLQYLDFSFQNRAHQNVPLVKLLTMHARVSDLKYGPIVLY